MDAGAVRAIRRGPHAYGWLPKDGNTVWFEQQLYLEQPGYGTSYLIGKAHIEQLFADRARQVGTNSISESSSTRFTRPA